MPISGSYISRRRVNTIGMVTFVERQGLLTALIMLALNAMELIAWEDSSSDNDGQLDGFISNKLVHTCNSRSLPADGVVDAIVGITYAKLVHCPYPCLLTAANEPGIEGRCHLAFSALSGTMNEKGRSTSSHSTAQGDLNQ